MPFDLPFGEAFRANLLDNFPAYLPCSYFPTLGKDRMVNGCQRPTTYSVTMSFLIATVKNWRRVNLPFPKWLLYVVIAWATALTLTESALQVSTTVSTALLVSFPTFGEVRVAVEQW